MGPNRTMSNERETRGRSRRSATGRASWLAGAWRRPMALAAAVALVALAACSPSPQPGRTPAPPAAGSTRPPSAGPAASPAPSSPPASPSVTASATPALPAGTPGEPAVLAANLATPWGLAFLPGGAALITSRDEATITRLETDGTLTPVIASGPGGRVPGVTHGGEGGLLGVAVPPGWADGEQIYLYRTTKTGNEVIAAPLRGTRMGEPRVLLGGIAAAGNHNGGRLAFGPDQMLYVTTGDAGQRAAAQDTGSLAGKILRLTPEGRPAPSNPWPGSPVWSYGHRNVQGIGWDEAGRLYASEFGQNTLDELNLITPGANYGWPLAEGPAPGGARDLTDPLVTWPTSQASPSGLAVTRDAVYLAALRGQRLWRVPVTNGALAGSPRAFYAGHYGRLRTVAVAPDGALWLLTGNTDGRGEVAASDDRVLRIALT